MHPIINQLLNKLRPIFDNAVDEACKDVTQKITDKGLDYDKLTPVWMRLTKASDYAAIIKIKSERVIASLEDVTLDGEHEWDDDNALDLIVYTLFLIAFSRFVKRRE